MYQQKDFSVFEHDESSPFKIHSQQNVFNIFCTLVVYLFRSIYFETTLILK